MKDFSESLRFLPQRTIDTFFLVWYTIDENKSGQTQHGRRDRRHLPRKPAFGYGEFKANGFELKHLGEAELPGCAKPGDAK